MSRYGTVIANAANSANRQTRSPSAKLRRAPKNRVRVATTRSGTSVPAIVWSSATRNPMKARKSLHSPRPSPAAYAATASEPSRPVETPTRIGVPAEPKETGVLWISIPATTAASGGKPRPTRSGTATAAGVPKPEEPSMNAPKSQAIRITWMRRSGVMPVKPRRITASAPLSCSVWSSSSAPKMM